MKKCVKLVINKTRNFVLREAVTLTCRISCPNDKYLADRTSTIVTFPCSR